LVDPSNCSEGGKKCGEGRKEGVIWKYFLYPLLEGPPDRPEVLGRRKGEISNTGKGLAALVQRTVVGICEERSPNRSEGLGFQV